jgi:hypothetical protein
LAGSAGAAAGAGAFWENTGIEVANTTSKGNRRRMIKSPLIEEAGGAEGSLYCYVLLARRLWTAGCFQHNNARGRWWRSGIIGGDLWAARGAATARNAG